MDKLENRRHFRLKEYLDVTWKVVGQDISGEGLIINISSSGILLNLDKVFRPPEECILSIESGAQKLPFGPKKGKMMWFRRIHTPQERLQCGVQFLTDKTDTKDNDFHRWLEMKISQLSQTADARIIGNSSF